MRVETLIWVSPACEYGFDEPNTGPFCLISTQPCAHALGVGTKTLARAAAKTIGVFKILNLASIKRSATCVARGSHLVRQNSSATFASADTDNRRSFDGGSLEAGF